MSSKGVTGRQERRQEAGAVGRKLRVSSYENHGLGLAQGRRGHEDLLVTCQRRQVQ